MPDDIKTLVRGYIVENILLGQQVDGFTDGASFLALGMLDSTAVLEVISFLEETFHIKVADTEMTPANLDSLEAIDVYVRRKQAARAGAPS